MRFEKVSYEQYLKDSAQDTYQDKNGNNYDLADMSESTGVRFLGKFFPLDCLEIEHIYEDIKLPARATKKSAGYDFFAPYSFSLAPGETIKVATGIRVILDDDKFLMCAPRSGHGFKSRLQLDNTIGIIDADYSESSNEGHIMVKLTNDSHYNTTVSVKKGDGLIQAMILPYFTVEDDDASRQRDGGFGSTDNQ